MVLFMNLVQHSFDQVTQWKQDNFYAFLSATAQNLLDFKTPVGLRLNVSSLSASHFASSYSVGTAAAVDGSMSYLCSSLPLALKQGGGETALRPESRGYRQLGELARPDERWRSETWQGGRRVDRRASLLYGRMFLPRSRLEGLYMRRLSAERQLRISCVSDARLADRATVLAVLQRDAGKYSTEYLFSSDSALLGFRGLYNFGADPRGGGGGASAAGQVGRFSAGAELYYGMLNKSGGASAGMRFTTLPPHPGFPYTMTLTLNPLMGNLASTYAVRAGGQVALCSRFAFNVYSYESEVQLGMELWRARLQQQDAGVLKLRTDSKLKVGVLWEGRVRSVLVRLGASLDLARREQIFRTAGVEIEYSP